MTIRTRADEVVPTRIGRSMRVLGLGMLFCAAPVIVGAQPYSIDEIPIPSSGTSFGMAADPDGSVWYTSSFPKVIGHVSPKGHITEYPILSTASSLSGIVIGPDGNLWFGEWSNPPSPPAALPLNRIARISKSGADFHEYEVRGGNPRVLIVGPDQNIWFTTGGGLGRITVDGEVTLFDQPESPCLSSTYGLTIGPDGAIWAATDGTGPVRFDLTTLAFQPMSIWPCGTTSSLITAGPDGNLWLSDFHRGHLFRVTLAGELTVFDLPGSPFGIVTVGNELFVARAGQPGRITRFDPFAGAVIEDYSTPAPQALPENIIVDPSGNVWFNEQDAKRIGRLSRDPLTCIAALALTYPGRPLPGIPNPQKLTIRLAVKTETPAFSITVLFANHSVFPLWSRVIPPVSPEVIAEVLLAPFPRVGPVTVVTALVTSSLEVCGDARSIDTGSP